MAFFRNRDEVFGASVIPLLEPMMVSKGEFIYKIGDHPNFGTISMP